MSQIEVKCFPTNVGEKIDVDDIKVRHVGDRQDVFALFISTQHYNLFA
ncbi:hypothetical protein KHA80_18385 [Anaerobacillus sp. HL2]|nr:hypothetical protein KHA80_18385 [Anaerobacillus sp. HL2]